MNLNLRVLTPNRVVWDSEVQEIILTTNSGQIGVLPNHTAIVTALDIGVMKIRLNAQWSTMALMGGFALVKQNIVTVLVNEAESAKTINSEEAESVFASAKTKLEEAEGQKQKVEANFAFKRARARYQVVKQTQN